MNARIVTAAGVRGDRLRGACSRFILTTVAMDTLPDAAILGVSALVAFAVVAVDRRLARGSRLSDQIDRQSACTCGGRGSAGLLGRAVARALSARNQRSLGRRYAVLHHDLLGRARGRGRLCCFEPSDRRSTGIAGAVCSAAGATGLLASWEYPSSFAPFARFPERETLMLLAGVLFAAGVLGIARALQRLEPREVTHARARRALRRSACSRAFRRCPRCSRPGYGVLPGPRVSRRWRRRRSRCAGSG